MNRNYKNKPRGILLLELVMAMIFISVSLIGLLNAYRYTVRARFANFTQDQLRLLSENKINQLDKDGSFRIGEFEGDFENSNYFWKMLVSNTDLNGLYKIELKVYKGADSLRSIIYLGEKDN